MQAGDEPDFDRQALLERLGGDRALARELIAFYLDEAPQMLESLRSALAQRDGRRVERAAHLLRGALASVAAPAAQGLAGRLEHCGLEQSLEDGPALLAALEGSLERLDAALRSMLVETG